MDEKLKKATEELSNKTGKAATRAKDKIAGQLDSEQIKKTAQAAADKSKETVEKVKNMAENIDAGEINKNVKEIGKKTKKELSKHSKKEIAIGIVILLILFAVLSRIGWGIAFEGLLFVSVGILIYDIVKKKKKKYAIVATLALALLTGYFNSNIGIAHVVSEDDLIHVFGKTQQEITQKYGNAKGIETLDSEVCWIYYDYWAYSLRMDLNRVITLLSTDRDKTLGGISVGDTRKKVDKIMKKAGLKETTAVSGADAIGYGTPNDDYHFDVIFDSSTNTVKSIKAYDLKTYKEGEND